METRAHYVLIGLFTLVTTVCALLFALWLGKSSLDREYNTYEVVFNEAVTGLSNGSAVQYSGIKVGDVTVLRLDPKDPRRVLAQIRLSPDTPVKQDTRARLAITGVTGSAIIQLYGGSPESPQLSTSRERPTIIKADPSPLSQLLADGGDLVTNINNLLENANRMFSKDNIENFSKTMAHLEQASSILSEEKQTIQSTLEQFAEVSKQASQLMNSHAPSILTDAQKAMTSLQNSTSQLEALISDNRGAMSEGLQGMADLGPAITDLRSTLGSLRQTIRRLNNNPSGLLLEREQRQEFQP